MIDYIVNSFADLYKYVKEKKQNELLLIRENFAESLRYKEYVSACQNCKIPENSVSMFFEWSQCKNPTYDKYNQKLLTNICENIDFFAKVFDLLSDGISQKIYFDICMWRIFLRASYLVDAYRLSSMNGASQYFDPIIKLNSNEIFIDAGGYIGDTIQEFISRVHSYEKIYCYEPDCYNIANARKNLKSEDRIVFRNVGLGNIGRTTRFNHAGLPSSSVTNDNNEEKFIEIVTLDEDVKEKITFLKMDIEGEELDALHGAREHIVKDRPILAICLYHNVEDIYTIPLYIHSIIKNYEFYIRHYTPYHGETVLYAIPKERVR